jgi:membrane-bound inhibitor of C-type lysozyme
MICSSGGGQRREPRRYNEDVKMHHRFMPAVLLAAACAALLSGCSSMFSDDNELKRSRTPPGATAYKCDEGKALYVRYIDDGKAAWVIFPDYEFRLNQTSSASGARYSNGQTTLDTKGNEATLRDSSTISYANCKKDAA